MFIVHINLLPFLLPYLSPTVAAAQAIETVAPQKNHPTAVVIKGGTYRPFYRPRLSESDKRIVVKSFELDAHPVTNQDYLEFVKKNTQFTRSQIGRVFAEDTYLKHWQTDHTLKNEKELKQPVTHVSWFAATAYCQWLGKDLPTTDQWEYALDDVGRSAKATKAAILKWYSVPNNQELGQIGQHKANGYGVHDLVGLVWEWTQDFNNSATSAELRSDGTKDENLFCASGSLNAVDSSDYVKFMRFSFRGSLQAAFTTANLGFRCAKELTP